MPREEEEEEEEEEVVVVVVVVEEDEEPQQCQQRHCRWGHTELTRATHLAACIRPSHHPRP